MRIRGVVFDKDGTLFDFRASWSGWAMNLLVELSRDDLNLARTVGARLGFDLDSGRFEAGSPLVAGTPQSILEELQREFSDWSDTEMASLIYTCSINAKMVEAVPLHDLLGNLHGRGYKLGVATNDAEGTAMAHLETAGVADHFDFVAGFDSVQNPKPEPDMLLAFCRETGIPPEETVMVGDSLSDMIAGINARMHTVGVLTGGEGRARLSSWADAVLDNIGLIPGWLEEANRRPDGCKDLL